MKRQEALPDSSGHFGPFGGQFVPETLMTALAELTEAYHQAREDELFQRELESLLRDYAGRPTPLYFAGNLSERLGGARIYLKREDLAHTGSHKINNALGQGLLPSAWASRAWSPRRALASTAWPLPPSAPSSVWSAWSTWARRTSPARPSTSSA